MTVAIRDTVINEIPAGPLSAAVDAAIDALDVTHVLPDGVLPVPVRPSQDPTALGRYRGDTTNPVEILIRTDVQDPGLTLTHELGHYLDHHALPPAGGLASASPAFAPWRHAVRQTGAAAELRQRALQPRINVVLTPQGQLAVVGDNAADAAYFLQVHELFARSYAQWAIAKSGNATLVAEVAAATNFHYPEQWNDQDFAPVSAALDGLLTALS